uniref:Uncharacterized protein n=1 Tax=Clandestinovirus TaxID=2831644 RepID=A0A8F8KNW3_9VIRU|nr:hypothetical protein KOM_12_327 [Clandestinovirus]
MRKGTENQFCVVNRQTGFTKPTSSKHTITVRTARASRVVVEDLAALQAVVGGSLVQTYNPENLHIQNGEIEEFTSTDSTIENLQSTSAQIDNIESNVAAITSLTSDTFTANDGTFSNLSSTMGSVDALVTSSICNHAGSSFIDLNTSNMSNVGNITSSGTGNFASIRAPVITSPMTAIDFDSKDMTNIGTVTVGSVNTQSITGSGTISLKYQNLSNVGIISSGAITSTGNSSFGSISSGAITSTGDSSFGSISSGAITSTGDSSFGSISSGAITSTGASSFGSISSGAITSTGASSFGSISSGAITSTGASSFGSVTTSTISSSSNTISLTNQTLSNIVALSSATVTASTSVSTPTFTTGGTTFSFSGKNIGTIGTITTTGAITCPKVYQYYGTGTATPFPSVGILGKATSGSASASGGATFNAVTFSLPKNTVISNGDAVEVLVTGYTPIMQTLNPLAFRWVPVVTRWDLWR